MIQVLIVDDSPEYCELLKTTLNQDLEIFPIVEANNGYDALEFCEIVTPDIILMDLLMAECDGIKGTTIIKNKFPDVKIIVMTSVENEGNLQKALEAGANGYFLKGIETPKLREAIKNVMNGVTTIDKEIFIP
ncbi:MAG: response regulator transcription factor [Firmicutes bacterium]|nr:response regulator transcription factor [Bacillota bacterium]